MKRDGKITIQLLCFKYGLNTVLKAAKLYKKH